MWVSISSRLLAMNNLKTPARLSIWRKFSVHRVLLRHGSGPEVNSVPSAEASWTIQLLHRQRMSQSPCPRCRPKYMLHLNVNNLLRTMKRPRRPHRLNNRPSLQWNQRTLFWRRTRYGRWQRSLPWELPSSSKSSTFNRSQSVRRASFQWQETQRRPRTRRCHLNQSTSSSMPLTVNTSSLV